MFAEEKKNGERKIYFLNREGLGKSCLEKENISMQRRGTKKEKEESVWRRNFYFS